MLRERMLALLSGFFAVVGLLLVAVGLYGVLSYSVVRRTREIGIRVALGARTRDVFRQVVAHGLAIVTVGVVVGLIGSIPATRLLGDVLFGVSPHDAAVLTFVAVLLLCTALMANGLPARRAARIDPMRSLRTD
jgi:ABC-type antimicrobial peptide transport system permease subunit